ncbi:MAG: permease-like cell division protein FtsX [Bacteroidales bacterium]|nr:permease-like cell division protein FtsX [Bacteroidales bacterium]
MSKIKRRLFRSYIVVTLSITLVLFLVGLISVLLLNTGTMVNYVRENIGFTLALQDDISEVDILQLQKTLDASPYVKSSVYIDKEQAAVKLAKELGEDFSGFLGENPLDATIDVKINAAWMHPDSLARLEAWFKQQPQVKSLDYHRNLVHLIHRNVQKISLFLLFFTVLLGIIFVALISSTIKLSIYSQRFDIHTMRLVGGTHAFIRRPLVWRIVECGIMASLIADIAVFFVVFSLRGYYRELTSLFRIGTMAATFIIVLLFGVLISYLSGIRAVNKYLKLDYNDLF